MNIFIRGVSTYNFTRLCVDRLNIVLPPNASSIIYRNRWDSLAPQQHIPPAVAAAERDTPDTHLKVVPS